MGSMLSDDDKLLDRARQWRHIKTAEEKNRRKLATEALEGGSGKNKKRKK